MELSGARVLITGASGGIGQALARTFAQRGGQLTLTGRKTEVLEPLAQELQARAITCDLADRDAVERLIAEAGEVDVLVANAGVPAGGFLLDLTQEQIDRMLEVNLRAPVRLARALTPAMVQRRHGHVVFISSLQGKVTVPLSSVYSATKFGLRGFALALRQDMRSHGVGVSVVLPGFIRDAGMFADSGTSLPPGVGTRSPQEVAAATVRAIERNRAELDVAPASLRLGSGIASLAPQLAATVSRWFGSEKTARDVVAGQLDKR